jgi:hypothetical protein
VSSSGASLGMMSSPLKRYTPLTVDDGANRMADSKLSGGEKASYVE